MVSTEGSGKWVIAIFFAILLVVVLCYPQQTLFLLKLVWDLIVLNLWPLFENIGKHWPFH
jgi:hypothetical protein